MLECIERLPKEEEEASRTDSNQPIYRPAPALEQPSYKIKTTDSSPGYIHHLLHPQRWFDDAGNTTICLRLSDSDRRKEKAEECQDVRGEETMLQGWRSGSADPRSNI